jgi:hypothetical protein
MNAFSRLFHFVFYFKIELEQIRASEKEVRCQHEDDYDECVHCKCLFSVTRRKYRCKHCCKIFCSECCSKSVNSGPNNRSHKVCDTCYMILDKTEKNNSTQSTNNNNYNSNVSKTTIISKPEK